MSRPPVPENRPTQTVSCIECDTEFEIHASTTCTDELKCDECHEQYWRNRLKEAAAFDDDETFSRKDAMERLKWEHRAIPCRLPSGEQLVKVSDTSYTVLEDATALDSVDDECPDCGYDRFRYSRYDNGVIMGDTIRCNCCDATLLQAGF